MPLTMFLLLLPSLYREKALTALCSAVHTTFNNTLCVQNVASCSAKPADTYGTVALGFSRLISICTAAEPQTGYSLHSIPSWFSSVLPHSLRQERLKPNLH